MPDTPDRLKSLEADVSNLKLNHAQIDQLIERFDVSIERLTEVSTTVSQLLAVQGSRLEFQEKTSDELTRLLEQRRKEGEAIIKEVYGKIDVVEKELLQDIDAAYSQILTEIKDLKKGLAKASEEQKKREEETKKKVENLEKWQWKIFGGAAVLAIVAGYFDIFAKIFG